MMTFAQFVETSINVITNNPSQDYTHPDEHTLPTYDMTPGFKPFTKEKQLSVKPSSTKRNSVSELGSLIVHW